MQCDASSSNPSPSPYCMQEGSCSVCPASCCCCCGRLFLSFLFGSIISLSLLDFGFCFLSFGFVFLSRAQIDSIRFDSIATRLDYSHRIASHRFTVWSRDASFDLCVSRSLSASHNPGSLPRRYTHLSLFEARCDRVGLSLVIRVCRSLLLSLSLSRWAWVRVQGRGIQQTLGAFDRIALYRIGEY